MDIHIDEKKVQEYAEDRVKSRIESALCQSDYIIKDVLRAEVKKFFADHKDELLEKAKTLIDKEQISNTVSNAIIAEVMEGLGNQFRGY
jgi:hypothetical protein